MKRNLFLAAAFVLGVLVAGVVTRARAEDPPAPKVHAPSPWEYKVFLVDAREFRDKEDWKDAVAKEDGNELRADPVFKGYVLNHLAKEGWELIQVLHPLKDKNEVVHFYLRRPWLVEKKDDGK